MADADVKFDGANLIAEGNWLKITCWDIKLDAGDRRSNNTGERRALVHGFNDELVVNYADDYPGGVVIRGTIQLPGKIKQNHVRLEATDLHIDHPDRRSSTGGDRRALVHGFNDELVINWAKDYPGGAVVHGNFEIQKSGSLKMKSSAGKVTGTLDVNGNLYLGGEGTDGDVILIGHDGNPRLTMDAQNDTIEFKTADGSVKVRIDTKHFTSEAWPAWPGTASPTRLDLITEMRRMKEEILTLRTEVDALNAGG
jgi:hypothetical protein